MSTKHVLQRFSLNARDALIRSQIIARTEAHSFVATHHLLLALTQQQEALAYRLLKEVDADIQKIAEICNRVIFKQRQETRTQGIEDELRITIQYAFEEAADLGSVYVGTEHLLLGIIGLDRSLAAQILINSQVEVEEIRQKIREMSALQELPMKPSKLEVSEGSAIESYGRDLTREAALSRLDPVISRDNEIARLIQILSRRTKNNPILLGEAGVGKTAVVEGLAQQIHARNVPASMIGKRVISLNVGALVAGTKFRGDFEERVMKVLAEIQEEGNIILFIDELHTLLGAGSAAGSLDAANILKPLLAKGEIQTIGATTFEEYQQFIEEDAALTRRFQPIVVQEPTVEQATTILQQLSPMYEAYHGVRYEKAGLQLAVQFAHRYITERHLPDSAIDIMDEAASQVKIQKSRQSTATAELQFQLEDIRLAKEEAVDQQRYDNALALRKQEQRLVERIDRRVSKPAPSRRSLPLVTKDDIARVVAHWLGVPVQEITQQESQKLLQLESLLHQRIVGQEEAIALVSRALRRSRVGLDAGSRPIGSFLFLGPSGVGKTETARALAELVFGSDQALIKLNMSEFMERHTASNLIGAPAGYVGYEEGGRLTEMVRRRPYAVLLFDEIEKAHPDIFNLLLQVLEDGELIDSKGRKVDFKNTIIMFTSNLGVELLSQKGRIGFSLSGTMDELEHHTLDAEQQEAVKERLLDNLKESFRPEFLNRLSGIVVFQSLTPDQVKKIADMMLNDLRDRLKPKRIKLQVHPTTLDYLVAEGYSQDLGVRPLRRLIERDIEDQVAEGILKGTIQKGQTVAVKPQQGRLKIQPAGRKR